jgi:Arc/MetJ-type ribon-helix-helix transcriptional regulator
VAEKVGAFIAGVFGVRINSNHGGTGMAYEFPPDVRRLIGQRMASGHYASEDELLREALHALGDDDADLEAIREAVSDMDAGDEGIPLDEAFANIRRKHGRPDSA